ncbi:cupin domain-containing protein [Aureispira anguillae]|uniref:Cupin domain-containing protein n=1 Tax=Aureispira anguillae TaxID=2864201 RepID=A0A915YBE8_9BACT|nr:cupin domain-containing protein [Aureispira anguillae]BDS09983.1 cupin domain-containing protein [Aureispira anguillae]
MFHKKLAQAPEFVAGDHTKLRELMHPLQDHLKIGYSLAHAKVEVGKASLPHRLKSSETYYILEGKGEMYIDDTSLEVGKDDVFLVPANASQYIKNTGDIDLVFLCIVEPYWQEDEEDIF